MKLIDWLQTNDNLIDWQMFAEPWDSMQLRHNPFRNEQIAAIIKSAGIEHAESPEVLDLGCGPGVLGRHILKLKPGSKYFGLDGDPLMLAAMQRLLPRSSILFDLRKMLWAPQFKDHFDSVISFTALHWMTEKHLQILYALARAVLKPGGTFIIGDPYLPDDDELQNYQQVLNQDQGGMSWNDFWQNFWEKYPIKEIHDEYFQGINNEELFQGSDEGYPLSFHLNALKSAGLQNAEVYWKKNGRAVFGAVK